MHTYIQTYRHTDRRTYIHTYIVNDSNPSSYPIRFPLFAFRGSVSVPAASDTSLPPPQEPKHIGGAFRMERFDVWKGGFREILGPRKFSGKLWYKCQPWMTPNGCLIGRVPFKYQILTIGGIPP